jgi:hypothetical protein
MLLTDPSSSIKAAEEEATDRHEGHEEISKLQDKGAAKKGGQDPHIKHENYYKIRYWT